MIVHKKKDVQSIENDRFRINNKEIKSVNKFLYLGTWFQEETDQFTKIKMRIRMAKTTFTKIKNILTRKHLDLGLRVRLVWCYIMPVLLYGIESRVLSHELEKRIEDLLSPSGRYPGRIKSPTKKY